VSASLRALPIVSPNWLEDEFAQDIWDVRHLPGVRYPAHRSDHLLNFTPISAPFRPALKRYLKLLLTQYSYGECSRRLGMLRLFLDFFTQRHPSVGDFRKVNRQTIEDYLLFLTTRKNFYGKPTSRLQKWRAIHDLKYFFEYLERTSSPEAASIPVGKLIWPSDTGKFPQSPRNTIKYIPEPILRQLEEQMHALPSAYLPVVILLRASGWRISDVLNLRYDTCVERTSSGWWLCGDIQKTQVLNHKVPISEEIAALVSAQCALVKDTVPQSENPYHYLFPASTEKRRGRPFTADAVYDALNRLAAQAKIQDESGRIFHFKTHAFRHTKAVELINNGMSLVHVQKWLAHLTPQMTLAYAQILDSTMRREWEQAFAKGAVRIDGEGIPNFVPTEQLTNEHKIEWEHIRHHLDAVRLPNGYCFKPKKADCPTQITPCYNCHHFCTTPDFLPQFEQEKQDLQELVELGKKAGSVPWVERNTQKLNRLLPVIQILSQGQIHHPAGKAVREYTPQERAKKHDS
jgi:integrase